GPYCILTSCNHFNPDTLQLNIVFLPFSTRLHCAPFLPVNSPAFDKITHAAAPAQILLQLIIDCEPVTPQCPIVLCTSLPAASSLLLPESRPIFPTETVIAFIIISTSEIHLPHTSKHASCDACSPNELCFPST
ncbi:hypothetical protein AVEN_13976-2-1, partial [Araneus ventricosus]